MRDPHVERLFYRLHTADTLTYEHAYQVSYETIPFKAELDQGRLTVEMKEHHPTEQSARARAEEWLRAWEIDTSLTYGPEYIHFEFDRSDIIDRNPPAPGEDQIIQVTAVESIGFVGTVAVQVTRSDYPPPPKAFKASSDVDTMWSRYQSYKQGREPLLSMAYFCLTVLEGSTGLTNGARGEAARRYNIDRPILDQLGELTSTRGGEGDARKFNAAATRTPLNPKETNWIEEALKLLIRRKGEYDYDPTVTPSPALTLNDLPTL